jgi:hypothetical protein
MPVAAVRCVGNVLFQTVLRQGYLARYIFVGPRTAG